MAVVVDREGEPILLDSTCSSFQTIRRRAASATPLPSQKWLGASPFREPFPSIL